MACHCLAGSVPARNERLELAKEPGVAQKERFDDLEHLGGEG